MPATFITVFLRMHPLQRFFISAILAVLSFLYCNSSGLNFHVNLMLAWDVFSLVYIIFCWVIITNRNTVEIRKVAKNEDGSRVFVLLLIVLASLASMCMVLVLISSHEVLRTPQVIYLPIAVAGMMLSWIMVHTIFVFHYAHLYYTDHKEDPKTNAGGVSFPGEHNPDYLDFAYFSFIIGMTFQVSDVSISARKIRRLALAHGLLSFGLNTFVVALTINVIAGLRK